MNSFSKCFVVLQLILAIVLQGVLAQEADLKMEEMTEKCQYYWGVNLDSAEYYGKMAVELARDRSDLNDDVARTYMFLAVVYYYAADDSSAISYVEEGLEVAEDINSDWGRAFGYNLLTILNRMTRDYAASIEYAQKTIALRQAQQDTFNLAGAYNNLSSTYKEMGYMELAIENQLIALELRMVTNDTSGLAMGHANISDIYLIMENVELAKEHIDLALRCVEDGSEPYANCLTILGDIMHTNYERPDTAYALYVEALEIYSKIGIDDGVGVAHENIGSTLMTLNRLDEALEHIKKADAIYQEMENDAQLAHVNMNYGEYYSKLDDYASSMRYLKKAYSYARKSQNSIQIQNALQILYKVNKLFGKDKETLIYLEQYKAYSDSLSTEDAYSQMAMLETRYKTLEKEHEITILKKHQEVQMAKQRLLVFIILGLILLGVLIVFLIQLKRRKDKQIHHQAELILEKEKALTTSELERSKLKERELQQGLEYRSKQLSTHALHMMQKNKLLSEIVEELDELKSSNVKDVNKRIKSLIGHSMRADKDWDTFRHYFEDVNQNFYTRLFELAPNLSVTDQKICALIKLNMDTKQMASVLNVATNSIKSSRYRLKKKLRLDAAVDMEAYVRGL